MKKIRWRMYEEGEFHSSNLVVAESDEDALRRVLKYSDHDVKFDKHYRVDVGDLTASSLGEDFMMTANASELLTGEGGPDRASANGYHTNRCAGPSVGGNVMTGEEARRAVIATTNWDPVDRFEPSYLYALDAVHDLIKSRKCVNAMNGLHVWSYTKLCMACGMTQQ